MFENQQLKNIFLYAIFTYLIIGIVIIFMGAEASYARADALRYHIPYIDKVINDGLVTALILPNAAMPPLYHGVASVLTKATGLSVYFSAQLISYTSSLLTLMILYKFSTTQKFDQKWNIFMLLVIILSWPFLASSFSPATDPFGILFFVLLLTCAANKNLLPLFVLIPY